MTTTHGQPSGLSSAGPLLPSDPPRIGPYWLEARLRAAQSGAAYLAHDDAGVEAVVVRLSEGAAQDAAARDRLSGLVNKLHIDTVLARGGQSQDEGRWARKFIPEQGLAAHDDVPEAPWVALQRTGTDADQTLAEHLLAEVELRQLAPQGTPSGPSYRHYWLNRAKPGLARIWPLPWPGRHERAGWVSLLVSWLLTALLLLLALLMVWLLFKDMPPQTPPDPIPSSQSGSGGSGEPSSADPSDPQSGEPSESGSPSMSGEPSDSSSPESGQPSGEPSESSSGGGGGSPRSRL
ncbi:MAG TPA: hypothetical protein IAA98_05610 [Candidatus Avipropionibacterium avicola]|uniref:Uncharacterized protein n=1 Tax=Candidatus Avipropionibacterium avicola TaxID=2840701 RepID=A0A9D1GY06_9ACTN|nr:hypothetical protein [Candidatus Avipropionibacterium avicola]